MTNYPGLSDMFYEGANVFKTHEGFRRSEEAAAAHQQGLAEAIQRQRQESEIHPLKMEYENQRARKQRLESDLAEREHPYKLKKIEYDAQEAEYKDMDRFGQALEQWGSIAEANQGQIPLELQARMPKELAAVFSQPDGWKQAKTAGTAMRENSQKWLSQQSKQGSAEDIAAAKLQAQQARDAQRSADMRYVAELRANTAKAVAAGSKAKAAETLKTLDAGYLKYIELASTATNEADRIFYTNLAQEIVQQKTAYINAQAAAKQTGTTDTGAVTGLPTRDAPKPRTVNAPTKNQPEVKKDAQGRIILD